MTKGIYAHQASQLAERTIEQFADTLALGGCDEVRIKTHQFTTWTGRFDAGPAWDMTSLVELRRVRDALKARGIRLVPWAVPMGLDVEAEAQFGAMVARECGALDLDVEPYAEFWPGIPRRDFSAVAPYFARLRQLCGPSIDLTLDVPARMPYEWPAVREAVRLAAPHVDRIFLQSYFGVAQAKAAEVYVAEVAAGRPVEHIADTVHLVEMLQWLRGRPVLVWVAQQMNSALYAALVAYTVAGPPAPGPVPAPQYVVGEGLRNAMAAHGDVPVSDEGPAGAPLRYSIGKSGRIYWYAEASNHVAVAEPV